MNTSRILRTAFALVALGATLAAQAVTIGLSSVGKTDFNPDPVTIDENVINQQGGFGVLSVLHIDVNNGPFPISLSGIYTGAGGSLSFDGTFIDGANAGGSQSVYGTWTYTGGTGTYANLTGSGTLAVVVDTSNPSGIEDSYTTFRGNLEAVPEPASMAVLGVGALGLLRRRRKA
jgi:hypothetical protein